MRTDGRLPEQMRTIEMIPDFSKYAEGSVLIKFGETHVLCNASVEPTVPKWLQGSGQGWVTAEYGMLPRSTHSRIRRDKALTGGRTLEISRLISRALRAAVDLKQLGERQINIDCDVLQADGGTRTAAISGGFVALAKALEFLNKKGEIKSLPLKNYVAAVSVGLTQTEALLDLNYDEDSNIDTDMNFVMNDDNEFIEIQGTAESQAFNLEQLNKMTELASKGCQEIISHQKSALNWEN